MASGPWVFDTDTHITEEEDTWDSVDPAFSSNGLRIRTGKDRWRRLILGRKKLTILHPLVQGEFDTMRVLTREDPRAYEKHIARRMAVPPPGPPVDPSENDAAARPAAMDAMGVSHAVIYPSLGLFWPHLVTDPELADAHHSAWNDWIAARTAGLRHRLLPVAQYSFDDPRRTAAEIRRCRKLGLRGLFVQAVPYRQLPWDHESYEPVWKALERWDMPLLLHFSVLPANVVDAAWQGKRPARHVGPSPQVVASRSLPVEAALTSLIFGGVLERHPRLRIGIIEYGGSWVPSFLHRIDFAFDFISPRNRYLRERLPLRPSGYFLRQVKVSAFWNEPLEWLIRSAGDTTFMFGSDYPHPEGNVQAVQLAQNNMGKLPRAAQRRFFRENARALFGES